MKWFIVVIALAFTVSAKGQQFTGTWIGSYYRNNPSDKRLFFYRLHLIESNDSLYGICEAFNAQSDLTNRNATESDVVATYKIYNYQFNSTVKNSNQFDLWIGEAIGNKSYTTVISQPPLFFKIECNVISANYLDKRPQIVYSSLPANDGSVGKFQVRKISNNVPDLTQFEWTGSSSLRKKRGIVKDKEHFSFLQKKTKNRQQNDAESRVTNLTFDQRQQELLSTIEVDSPVISIRLYDNGIIDNDTVSLYLNDKVVLEKKRVSSDAIHLELSLEKEKENSLSLFAHNLGNIAPNTAYMIVKSGAKEYKLFLSATLDKNVLILLKPK